MQSRVARVIQTLSQLANRLKLSLNAEKKKFPEGKIFSRPLASANICNVVLMRNHELFTGIEVKDKDGHVVGTSQLAARKVQIINI